MKPNVFVKARFNDYLNPKAPKYIERKLQREESWTKKFKWYHYVTRADACLKVDIDIETFNFIKKLKLESEEELKIEFIKEGMEELIDSPYYFSRLKESKKWNDYIDFIDDVNKKSQYTGLWDENGPILKENEEKKLNEFSQIKDNQLIFEQVFSLDSNFMTDNGFINPRQFWESIKDQMSEIVKGYGFNDPGNINWNVAFHVNTDNFHAHISFWEKEPKFIEKVNGEFRKTFKKKGEIEHINFLNTAFLLEKQFNENKEIRAEIYNLRKSILDPFNNLEKIREGQKTDLWKETKEIYASFQKAILNDRSGMLKLSNYFRKNRVMYNSKNIDKKIRNRLDLLCIELISKNKLMNKKFEAFKTLIKAKQIELINISEKYYGDKYPFLYEYRDKINYSHLEKLGIKSNDRLHKIFNFYNEQMYGSDGFFSRIGNQFIKELKVMDYGELIDYNQTNRNNGTSIIKTKKRVNSVRKTHKSAMSFVLDNQEREALKKFKNLQKSITKDKAEQQNKGRDKNDG